MTVNVFPDLPRAPKPKPLFISASEAARVAAYLGWDEQIELNLPPAEVLSAIALAKSLGLAHDAFDGIAAIARDAQAIGHGVDFHEAFTDDTVGQAVEASEDPLDAPSCRWCASNLAPVLEALGVALDSEDGAVGDIAADDLLARCERYLNDSAGDNDDIVRRVLILRDIASYARLKGVRVVWG